MSVNKTGGIPRLPRDARFLAIQMVREMIEYRNEEMSSLSSKLKRTIAQFHRERSPKQHLEQYKDIKSIMDQISRHISDNDYDINHLQIFLTQSPDKVIYPINAEKTESSETIHYIQ